MEKPWLNFKGNIITVKYYRDKIEDVEEAKEEDDIEAEYFNDSPDMDGDGVPDVLRKVNSPIDKVIDKLAKTGVMTQYARSMELKPRVLGQ